MPTEFAANQKFFVVNGDLPSYAPEGTHYAVQLLDATGLTTHEVHLKPGETIAVLNGIQVPFSVIEAAWNQPLGMGTSVDINGDLAPPFTS